MTSKTERLTELVRAVAFAGRAAAEEWVRDSGLTRQQAFTLGYLEQNQDRDVIARELAEMSGTTAASVTSLLQGLEERGYVTRTSSPTDARIKVVRVTPEGARVVAGFDESMAAEQRKLFASLDEHEQDRLIALLEKVTADDASAAWPPGSGPRTRR
ncbi:MarR family winged helix-turn-helix transcriptional regulator [Leifsonia shinshuensis]|uniref:MarR family transcriptional regulator n=1 Tax=Leifsonia shinshuensis TaxID=150026 RepID=A0A7G6YB86_9MICO|nr:MarR family transcriptional regulator [Leifsonia shinshuensis]QNE35751.1 MarR family transcriptional regulator [Leifsonia shinshuensis]